MTLDLPGFADPVSGAQACFRAVLDAMSHPGRLMQAGDGLTPPAPLAHATAAVLLTLANAETPLWLDAQSSAARPWLAFHCGAPEAGLDQAAFAVALVAPHLDLLDAGTHEAPQDGTTLILQVAALGSGTRFMLEGPGLRTPTAFAADGLPTDFVAQWAANHARFPRGVDLILCAGTTLAALPRSVTVRED